ncbi:MULTISPECIES: hypothetical protein [Aeromonas]|uniref:Uncharacterized protein n=2 Tax=Aeromonas veronii TaxID=654 RepID=A0A653LD05_AERVE|nr:hypothetical protein HMPREF1169_03943 [Aeromonas veronii AER397]EKB24445.1 hypothetical protein HMPREF1170_00710 [Aeromonas veronii AMC35]BBT97069.1 hypothetical protein WP8W19C03_37630 [Aeromonas veronii]SIR36889.1 hypothetical protein SAMN05892873_13824 [Aeromonas veronii]VXA88877.1 conserved hypothetical protein [Aeromonas veronii]
MRTMKIQRVFPALMAGLLAGCSLLPQQAERESSDIAFAKRMEFANKEMQVRLQYSDWLLASHPQQRVQERQRLKGADDLESRVSLAMVDSHPAESVANRTAGLARLKQMLPELGLDAQAFLRSWIALGEQLLARDSRRDDQSQEIQRLRRQIEQLTAIDDQLNQRKLNENREVIP